MAIPFALAMGMTFDPLLSRTASGIMAKGPRAAAPASANGLAAAARLWMMQRRLANPAPAGPAGEGACLQKGQDMACDLLLSG